MSEAFLGGLAGLVLGLLGFVMCQFAAGLIERNPNMKDRVRVAERLRTLAYVVLIGDVLVGYFALGPVVTSLIGEGVAQ